jgi:glycosyltransferase involved in cell wall biosynthesis
MKRHGFAITIVDHRANIGGGRRFTSSLTKALAELCPSCSIRLVTTREALGQGWFGNLERLSLDTFGLVTEQTARQWLPDGRFCGLPGTWRVKAAARQVLLKTQYRLDKQLERALKGADLAYFAWPYFIDYINLGVPVVSTFHDLIWKYVDVSTPADKESLESQIPQWLAGSNAIVTSTTFMRQEIEKFYPGTAKRVEVIPLPAPQLPAPLVEQPRSALLARSNIHGRYAFCPAGLWVHKNHETLIRAFALVKKGDSALKLVCSGMYTDQAFGASTPAESWPRARALRQLTLETGLKPGEDIIGLGHVSDLELATLYAAASCVVMPVTYEAGSFPILEAAAEGVPIVCSDIPVYREQAEIHGLRPLYFDPRQPEALAEALEQLSRNRPSPDVLQEVATRARARTWLDVAREYLQVFESVI